MAKDFSNLAKDGSARVMQVASSIQTYDASTVVKSSPYAYTAADISTLTAPSSAAEIVLSPSTALRVSEDSTMATYFVVGAGTTFTFGLGRSDYLYVRGDAANGTLNFYFNLV